MNSADEAESAHLVDLAVWGLLVWLLLLLGHQIVRSVGWGRHSSPG